MTADTAAMEDETSFEADVADSSDVREGDDGEGERATWKQQRGEVREWSEPSEVENRFDGDALHSRIESQDDEEELVAWQTVSETDLGSLGSDARDDVTRWEAATGSDVRDLADSLSKTAALLATFRLFERGR